MKNVKNIYKVDVAGNQVWLPTGPTPFRVGLEIPEGTCADAPAWTGDSFFLLPRGKIVAVGKTYLYGGTTLEIEREV